MFEITYRFTPGVQTLRLPRDADEAVRLLGEGNRSFASLGNGEGQATTLVLDADFGFGTVPAEAPEQQPFGIVVGCADARVPIELVFGCSVNDLFVVRLAGNTVGSDALGSIAYAIDHFPSLRVAVVLGHSHCGAVSAAVDAFIHPGVFLELAAAMPLRFLLDRILTSVRASSDVLQHVYGVAFQSSPGYRDALIEMSIHLNAALSAYHLRAELAQESAFHVRVVYGVYDLATRRAHGPDSLELGSTPPDAESFRELAFRIARSERVRTLAGS